MKNRGEQAFTIVEVMLFLALTGLFLLIAFIGVGSRSQQVQFTDSMRSLQSFMQKQQNDILNGVNPRLDDPDCTVDPSGAILWSSSLLVAGQSNCAMLGKMVVFQLNSPQANVHTILGRALSSANPAGPNYLDPSQNDIELIDGAQPHALDVVLMQPYEMEWQSEFVEGFNNTTANPIKGIGFIRSPGSTNILNFAVLDCFNFSGDTRLDFDSGTCILPLGTAVAARLCFEASSGQKGTIKIGGSQSDSIEITFDEVCDAP